MYWVNASRYSGVPVISICRATTEPNFAPVFSTSFVACSAASGARAQWSVRAAYSAIAPTARARMSAGLA
jgi:hypothetical protein